MNWRDTLVGAGITLVVTILAGVVVWFLTAEPKTSPSAERLLYSATTSGTFGSDKDSLTFLNLRVSNVGNKPAVNIHVFAKFPSEARIQNKRISISSQPDAAIADHSDSTTLNLDISRLLPNEDATISLLVKGPASQTPTIAIHSDESVAQIAPTSLAAPASSSSSPPIWILIGVIGGALVGQAMLLRYLPKALTRYLPKTLSRLRPISVVGHNHDINNTAFVLLQQGIVDEASHLLSRACETVGGSAITIANQALACGLKGDADGAGRRFKIADWWADNDRDRAVACFNQSVLAIAQGQNALARDFLQRAFAYDREEIARYCTLSVYINDAILQDTGLADMVGTAGAVPATEALPLSP